MSASASLSPTSQPTARDQSPFGVVGAWPIFIGWERLVSSIPRRDWN